MKRKERIEHLLQTEFSPLFIRVENESHQHHVPEGSQTHFNVTLVSPQFSGLTRIARHRLVNHQLNSEFEQGLHALSLHLFTPDEWKTNSQTVLKSPACRDGYKNK